MTLCAATYTDRKRFAVAKDTVIKAPEAKRREEKSGNSDILVTWEIIHTKTWQIHQ